MRVALPKLFFWHGAEDAMHRVVFSQVKRKSDGIVCLAFAPFTEVRGQLNDGSLVQGSIGSAQTCLGIQLSRP
jgi:hypothetical protein